LVTFGDQPAILSLFPEVSQVSRRDSVFNRGVVPATLDRVSSEMVGNAAARSVAQDLHPTSSRM